jgi:hypothetical protein
VAGGALRAELTSVEMNAAVMSNDSKGFHHAQKGFDVGFVIQRLRCMTRSPPEAPE